MIRILITGTHSYIGKSFYNWLVNFKDQYEVDFMSLRDEGWKNKSFKMYDAILHTVGIAHVQAKPAMAPLYYAVNRDLAINVAKQAKKDGVKQFVFLSSIMVYGDSHEVGRAKIITNSTTPNPSNFYGNSKLEAELGLKSLMDDHFKVCIVRLPMVYGKGSRGNYPKLSKAARIVPIIPDIDNHRSMIHIDNLCEFLRLIITNGEQGVFFPQNNEHVRTSDMIRMIAEVHGKTVYSTRLFNPLIKWLGKRINTVNKVFGNLAYDLNMSHYKQNYRIHDLKESIRITER